MGKDYTKMMAGSPVLMGSNTIPGLKIPPEVEIHLPTIFNACRDFGLDFFPTIIEFLTYDQISEIASYGGFPVRYPHWTFGMEYEELSKGFEHGMHRIYEMVVNCCPAIIYCLNSNTVGDNLTVIAHALGHNDFFKNNIFFQHTNRNMLTKMANHGTRIRRYMTRWGEERVTDFIDHLLRIDNLIDPSNAQVPREYKPVQVRDERKYKFPTRRPVEAGKDYMEPWLNSKEDIDKKWKKIRKEEAREEMGILPQPDKDIFKFLRDNAPLRAWEQDVMSMLYEEAMYFAPQAMTKTLNEGLASWVDYNIMARMGLIQLGQGGDGGGIVEYSKNKMSVLGGKYSMNPYKLGFCLLSEIEDRWNKGKFGPEYEECTDIKAKEDWDLHLGLGKEKVFEVRKYYNDMTLINSFFDQDFCDKYEFFEWEKQPNGDIVIAEDGRNAKKIKAKLIQRYSNRHTPDIRITDDNHLGRGWLCLEHFGDGRNLHDDYARRTLTSIYSIWKKNVVLTTIDEEGDEYVYVCEGDDLSSVGRVERMTYEKAYLKKKK